MMPASNQHFIIEHQCPQCGSPAELSESDRLIRCGFCRVASYLTVPDLFRYILVSPVPVSDPLIYFPYWLFKGMLFLCLEKKTEYRFLDASFQAADCAHLPLSLGFRSQTQKIRFAATATPNTLFVKPDCPRDRMMHLLDQRFTTGLRMPLLHQAYIGETVSMIYMPYYRQEHLVDAITGTPVPAMDADSTGKLLLDSDQPAWPITFLPAICPHCGWDLDGLRNSLVLPCRRCRTTFREVSGRLIEVETRHVPSTEEKATYIPFWRIQADVKPVRLKTYADLIRLANLPKVVRTGIDDRAFYFWSPAFKVRPQTLLMLASQLCLNQPDAGLTPGTPESGDLQCVDMPQNEAAESLKVVLSDLMRPRERMTQVIADLNIAPRSFDLVYLPFRQGPHELINDGLNLAINNSQLNHSRNL